MQKEKRKSFKVSKTMKEFHLDFMRTSNLHRRRVPKQVLYTGILTDIFTEIFKEIIYNGYIFKFVSLGRFYVIKYLPTIKLDKDGKIKTNKPVNIRETAKVRKETGKKDIVIYYDNDATNGYTYRLIWDKTGVSFVNMYTYVFKLLRPHKKILHNAIMDDSITAMLTTLNL